MVLVFPFYEYRASSSGRRRVWNASLHSLDVSRRGESRSGQLLQWRGYIGSKAVSMSSASAVPAAESVGTETKKE